MFGNKNSLGDKLVSADSYQSMEGGDTAINSSEADIDPAPAATTTSSL